MIKEKYIKSDIIIYNTIHVIDDSLIYIIFEIYILDLISCYKQIFSKYFRIFITINTKLI